MYLRVCTYISVMLVSLIHIPYHCFFFLSAEFSYNIEVHEVLGKASWCLFECVTEILL